MTLVIMHCVLLQKEEVENALRVCDMNMDEALNMLSPLRTSNMDGWRNRHEDHYDHQPFPGQRFPTGPSTPMSFPSVSFIFLLHCHLFAYF